MFFHWNIFYSILHLLKSEKNISITRWKSIIKYNVLTNTYKTHSYNIFIRDPERGLMIRYYDLNLNKIQNLDFDKDIKKWSWNGEIKNKKFSFTKFNLSTDNLNIVLLD